MVLCTMTFVELQYDLCQSIKSDILKRISNILQQNSIIVFDSLIQFDIMPTIDEASILHMEDNIAEVYEGINSDSKENFETTYKASEKDEDGDVGVEAVVKNIVVPPAVNQLMDFLPFMHSLDFDSMHAPEFFEYANMDVADVEDDEFRIRKLVITTTRSYIISRGVNYNVYESEPQTFYAKYKTYGCEYDWLIRASLIQKKGCWKI
ncbi:hypothetical protein AHAS_Ahas02G0205300 [Arachis hypogaea]